MLFAAGVRNLFAAGVRNLFAAGVRNLYGGEPEEAIRHMDPPVPEPVPEPLDRELSVLTLIEGVDRVAENPKRGKFDAKHLNNNYIRCHAAVPNGDSERVQQKCGRHHADKLACALEVKAKVRWR